MHGDLDGAVLIMVDRQQMQGALAPIAAILLSGCTLISGVGDYEVVGDGDAGNGAAAMTEVRDLNFSFKGMVAHAAVPLDIAVVDEKDRLQARARVILPPLATPYPTEQIVMHNALTPGKQTLYFFADNDGDGQVDGAENKIVEHVWIEPVAASGVGEFTHNTNFDYFNQDAYTPLNGALVLEMPNPSGVAGMELLSCIESKLGEQVDVELTLIEQDRQVGLFRRYRGTELPTEIRLSGVLDGGSMYRIQVVIDGAPKKTLEKRAPATDDLIVSAGEWFPSKLASIDCR